MDEFDRAWLTDMLDHAELAVELLGARDADALEADVRTLFAVSYALQTIGEAASHVSRRCQASLPGIPWEDVIGMRHRLVHGYRTRSALVIAETVREHLPTLIATVRRALEDSTP